jgi:hypothetical protein
MGLYDQDDILLGSQHGEYANVDLRKVGNEVNVTDAANISPYVYCSSRSVWV